MELGIHIATKRHHYDRTLFLKIGFKIHNIAIRGPRPYRVCPHVVVVVGFVCFNDLWGYVGRATHARQTFKDPGFTPCAGEGEVRFSYAAAHQTWFWK